MERALVLWNFSLYFSACGTHSGVVLYFSACGTRSGIVEFRVIFFRLWNALWYCGILCYIFLRMWNALWYCGISCYIFLHVECTLILWNFVLYFPYIESSGGDNSTSIYTCVLYFLCCIKITSLSSTASSDICLEYFWSDYKEDSFL